MMNDAMIKDLKEGRLSEKVLRAEYKKAQAEFQQSGYLTEVIMLAREIRNRGFCYVGLPQWHEMLEVVAMRDARKAAQGV